MRYVWLLFVTLSVPFPTFAGDLVAVIAPHGEWESPDNGKQRPLPPLSRFSVWALEDLDQVRVKIQLFVNQDFLSDTVNHSVCFLAIDKEEVADARPFFIHGENGLELWFPQLKKQQGLVFIMVWKEEKIPLRYATLDLISEQGRQSKMWTRMGSDDYRLRTLPALERSQYYKEFPLDEACTSFTAEGVQKFLEQQGASLDQKTKKDHSSIEHQTSHGF